MINIPKRLENLKSYNPGKPINELAREKGLHKIVKLASNENLLGPSPKAMEAIKASISNAHRYVDPASTELVNVIAKKFNKKPNQIICGHGIDSLLGYILVAFTEGNDEVIASEGSFVGIYVHTNKLGCKLSRVKLNNYSLDLNSILASVSKDTKVIYLANPNNPTGTIFSHRQFEDFIAQVPNDVLVLLDEAYKEYIASEQDSPDGLEYEYENIIVTRSLSKSYGLAGLRIGFAVGPEYLIKELYKIKLPFEPNYLAQIAAIAALNDEEFLNRTLEANRKSLDLMIAKFDQLGIQQVRSSTNFILLLMPSEKFAKTFFLECLNKGLILRHVKPFGIPNGIRINSGTEDETAFALEIIEQTYKSLLKSDSLIEV